MATTTNYGWVTPDDTALVKDGAAAIRTLGSSADTTTKNLNPETTLGDLAYRSSTANVNQRLALGTAGQVLQVNSGATAPQWATPAAGGGITQLATGSLNSVSTVTISSISQSYKNLITIVQNAQGTSNGTTAFRPNNVTTASSYDVVYNFMNATTWYTGSASRFSNNVDVTTDANDTTIFEIPNYTATGYKMIKLTHAAAAASRNVFMWGTNNDTSAVTSLVIYNGDGSNFSSGTYTLFGVS